MKIADELRLKDLQLAFRQVFPFLKIEFFLHAHDELERSPEREQLDANILVGVVREKSNSGELDFNDIQTTGAFEHKMQLEYGLNVQVYRKERGQWLQTWTTDIWTLQEQNRRSEIMANKD